MGDETEVLEASLPALSDVILSLRGFTEVYRAPSASARIQISCAQQHTAGAKSRALARVSQAEGIDQHHRHTTYTAEENHTGY